MNIADNLNKQNDKKPVLLLSGAGAVAAAIIIIIVLLLWTRGCEYFRPVEIPWKVSIVEVDAVSDLDEKNRKRAEIEEKFQKSKSDPSLQLQQEFIFEKCNLRKLGFQEKRVLRSYSDDLADNPDNNSERRKQLIAQLQEKFGKNLHVSIKLVTPTPVESSSNMPNQKEKTLEEAYLNLVLSYVKDFAPEPPSAVDNFRNDVINAATQQVESAKVEIINKLRLAENGLKLRRDDHWDVVMQYQLRAELAAIPYIRDQDTGNWLSKSNASRTFSELIELNILGAEDQEKAKRFLNDFKNLQKGQNMTDLYRQSYCEWIYALMRHRLSDLNNEQWKALLGRLKTLSQEYSASKGPTQESVRRKSTRIDGSIITLALYAIVTLRLEENRLSNLTQTEELRSSLDVKNDKGLFQSISKNLLIAAKNHDGVLDPKLPRFTSYGDPNRLVGGKFLYYSLEALLALDDGSPEKAKTSMKNALVLKNRFREINENTKLSLYTYCYVLRAAIANARICSRIEINKPGEKVTYAESWTKEWLEFATWLNTKCSEAPIATNFPAPEDHSHYYWYLARLAFCNGINDEIPRWEQMVGGPTP